MKNSFKCVHFVQRQLNYWISFHDHFACQWHSLKWYLSFWRSNFVLKQWLGNTEFIVANVLNGVGGLVLHHWNAIVLKTNRCRGSPFCIWFAQQICHGTNQPNTAWWPPIHCFVYHIHHTSHAFFVLRSVVVLKHNPEEKRDEKNASRGVADGVMGGGVGGKISKWKA